MGRRRHGVEDMQNGDMVLELSRTRTLYHEVVTLREVSTRYGVLVAQLQLRARTANVTGDGLVNALEYFTRAMERKPPDYSLLMNCRISSNIVLSLTSFKEWPEMEGSVIVHLYAEASDHVKSQ